MGRCRPAHATGERRTASTSPLNSLSAALIWSWWSSFFRLFTKLMLAASTVTGGGRRCRPATTNGAGGAIIPFGVSAAGAAREGVGAAAGGGADVDEEARAGRAMRSGGALTRMMRAATGRPQATERGALRMLRCRCGAEASARIFQTIRRPSVSRPSAPDATPPARRASPRGDGALPTFPSLFIVVSADRSRRPLSVLTRVSLTS